MASRFDKNTINLESTSNPLPPSTSNEVKIFNENGTLSKIDFSGKVTPLIPKIAPTATNLAQEELVILDPARLIMSFPLGNLNEKLNNLYKNIQEKLSISDFNVIVENVNKAFEKLSEDVSKNASESETSLNDLENTLNESITSLEASLKTLVKDSETSLKSDLESFKSEVAQFFINVQKSLNDKVSKNDLRNAIQAIPKVDPVKIKAGSSNVTVEKTNNEYSISVDVPKVTQAVSKSIGGGISKAAVQKIVDEAIAANPGGVGEITSADGTVIITELPNGFDLSVPPTSGSAFIPIAGNGITLTPGAGSYTFAVSDYISKTEVGAVSGNLQSQINTKASIGSLSTYTPLSTTSNISGNLQGQLDLIPGSYASIGSLSAYTLTSTTQGISAYLNDKIDSINLVQGSNITIVESPVNTWTISGVASSGSGATQLDELSDVELSSPTNGQILSYNGTKWVNSNSGSSSGGGFTPIAGNGITISPSASNYVFSVTPNIQRKTIGFIVDGAGSIITSGAYMPLYIPYNCTIESSSVVSDVSASVSLDIIKANGSLPTLGNTICDANKPTLNGILNTSVSITNWNLNLLQNDIMRLVVISNNASTMLNLQLKVVV